MEISQNTRLGMYTTIESTLDYLTELPNGDDSLFIKVLLASESLLKKFPSIIPRPSKIQIKMHSKYHLDCSRVEIRRALNAFDTLGILYIFKNNIEISDEGKEIISLIKRRAVSEQKFMTTFAKAKHQT